MRAELISHEGEHFLVITRNEKVLPYIFIPPDFPMEVVQVMLGALNITGKVNGLEEILAGGDPNALSVKDITDAIPKETVSTQGRPSVLGISAPSTTRQYHKTYYQRNRDKIIARARKWQQEHPDRAKMHQKEHKMRSGQVSKGDLPSAPEQMEQVEQTNPIVGEFGADAIKHLDKDIDKGGNNDSD